MKDAIIDLLKEYDGYLSGEEISRHFNLSRAAIWKSIEELRKDGYGIEAIPHKGYRLDAVPDKLLPREIQKNLQTQFIGRNIQYFDSVESTMNIAFQAAVDGVKEGTVVCAECQTQGRGRMGRVWTSPKAKGIYMSIILRPNLPIVDIAKINFLLAVAVSEAITQVTKIDTQIKWPNDLLIGTKKVAGLLTEMSAEMDRLKFIVAGIGLNVNTPLSSLPVGATSLKQHCKLKINRTQLMQEMLLSIERWYVLINANGFDPVVARWKELTSTLGSRVKMTDAFGEIEGEAIDLDEYGGLMIRNDQGVTVKRMSGDVVQLT